MLWRVRTTMADRPGSLAGLADRCGKQGVNILSLQIFPDLGRVTDELVLDVPADWGADQVEALVASAGAVPVAVGRCSERSLVDAPTKYLQAAAHLLERPSAFTDVLAELLDAHTAPGGSARPDVLRVDAGRTTAEVRRAVLFTEVERVRAAALGRFAQLAVSRAEDDLPTGRTTARPSDVGWSVRRGRLSDAAAVRRMHERCSTETLHRRFHSPTHRLPAGTELALLEPAGGASFVAAVGDEVVAMVVVAPHRDDVMEMGVLVEDGWQRQGIGAALVHTAVVHARGLGSTAMLAITQPDNRTLLATLWRCGLTCRVRTVDGAAHVAISLGRSAAGTSQPDRGGPAVPASAS